jgi:hypothetical protein
MTTLQPDSHSTRWGISYLPASAAVLALAALVCLSNAYADEAVPPAYKVGDKWSYAYVDELTPAHNAETDQSVVQVSPEHMVMRGKDAAGNEFEVQLDANGNLEHSGHYAPAPNDARLKFPMAVGTTWTAEYDLGSVHYKEENKVAALENVQTKAETFQAYRIESEGQFTSAGWRNIGRVVQTIWYAPAAKRIVKNDWYSSYGSNSVPTTTHLELTAVKLAQ